MLEVLEVDEAGDDAEEAFVSPELASTFLPLPLGGDEAEATADDLEDPAPGGEVSPVTDLLVPGAPSGVGLFLEVEVDKSCGDATLVEEVESAYLQVEVEGTEGVTAP